MERVLRDFNVHPKARPKKKKGLLAKIANLIKKEPDGPEVQSVIDRIEEAGKLKFDEKDVLEYHL